MTTIPDTLESVTASWLSSALDLEVESVQVVDDHEGTTGRAVLALSCAPGVTAPSRLFVKLPPSDPAQRAFVCANGMGRRESMFYSLLSREIPLRLPASYYSAWDSSGQQYIMLLEDLSEGGCTFRNASTRYSLDYVREVLSDFARMHAAFWESPRFVSDLDWLEEPPQDPWTRDLIARALELHRDSMPAVFNDMGELYLARTDEIHQLWKRGAHTLIHGDVHDGNLFYDRYRPGFLDWALVGRGPAMRDVGYFLAGTLTPEHQSQSGLELLAYYREELIANGVSAPLMDELYKQYQWHSAYVWVGAAVTLAMGDAWQSSSYVLCTMERLHHALEVLDTVAAVETGTELSR